MPCFSAHKEEKATRFHYLENHKISCVFFVIFLVSLTVAMLSFCIRLTPLEAIAVEEDFHCKLINNIKVLWATITCPE